jgi:hypothetical protein
VGSLSYQIESLSLRVVEDGLLNLEDSKVWISIEQPVQFPSRQKA